MVSRPLICIQGLGFVGAAMAAAVARATQDDGEPAYDVIGIDLPTPEGRRRIDALNAGRFPFETVDRELRTAVAEAHAKGNLRASADPAFYERASVVVVDVHLDVEVREGTASTNFTGFRAAIRTLGERLVSGALILVETTVPPGTTAKIVAPEIEQALGRRGLPSDAILIAHSYERVMPGPDYLRSITHFWRVYAGHTEEAAEAACAFLSRVIDVERFPLTRLGSTTASETAKVMENSYRAVNIAFIDEWRRFAEVASVDLFEVIDAIRVRPTHNNIRQPGLGVGGYCLTKDPDFGPIAARELFSRPDLAFPFSTGALAVNAESPRVALDRLIRLLNGSIAGKRILLLGVAYRSDVDDTRYSPSEGFVRAARSAGAEVVCQDPLVTHWDELKMDISRELPSPKGFDAIVFAVAHGEYRAMDVVGWLADDAPLVFDANRVLNAQTVAGLRSKGVRVALVGVGDAV